MSEIINNIKIELIGLFKNNYQSNFHVREMAKLINKSHVALLPYLDEFAKDGLMNSKKIGKNKVYSLVLSNNSLIELLSISEKKKTLDEMKKNKILQDIHEKLTFMGIESCLVKFIPENKQEAPDSMYILSIGKLNEFESRTLKDICSKNNIKLNLFTGSIEQFRLQLPKQTQMIKDVLKNHTIIMNHDIFVKELFNYYSKG